MGSGYIQEIKFMNTAGYLVFEVVPEDIRICDSIGSRQPRPGIFQPSR